MYENKQNLSMFTKPALGTFFTVQTILVSKIIIKFGNEKRDKEVCEKIKKDVIFLNPANFRIAILILKFTDSQSLLITT